MTKDLDLFFEDYTVVMNHLQPDGENGSWNGCMFETYGQDLAFVSEHPNSKIWTIVDGDFDSINIIPGFHFVNREGYLITKEDCKDETIDYVDFNDIHFEDWVTIELFEYLKDNEVIDYDAEFEDWMNERTDMLDRCAEFREEQINSFLNK